MISKTLTVINPSGLHLRPAGVLSQTAMKFKSDITIECGEKKIIAKSVLNVMAAGIKSGTEINLICDGEDEEEAMKTLTRPLRADWVRCKFRCKIIYYCGMALDMPCRFFYLRNDRPTVRCTSICCFAAASA